MLAEGGEKLKREFDGIERLPRQLYYCLLYLYGIQAHLLAVRT
jgi:hypothetical protein